MKCQGSYKLPPISIPAGTTHTVSINQVVAAGQPDEDGTVIPPQVTFGSAKIRGEGEEILTARLAVVAAAFDPVRGMCAEYLGGCPYVLGVRLEPNPIAGFVGDGFGVAGWIDFEGEPPESFVPNLIGFNSSVVQVSGNFALLVGAGSTHVEAWPQLPTPESADPFTKIDEWTPCYCDTKVGSAQVNASNPPPPATSISQDNRLWYFGSGLQAPSGFTLGSTSATLTANGVTNGTFHWTVTNGATKLAFENGTTSITKTNASTVRIFSASFSTAANDVTVRLEYTPPGSSQTQTLTRNLDIDSPYKLESSGVTTHRGIALSVQGCETNAPNGSDGFQTLIPYRIMSFFGQLITNIGFNETFGPTENVVSNNWGDVPPEGLVTPTGTFVDNACTVGNLTPHPLPPQSPLSSTVVQRFPQTWYVGSASSGLGLPVQTDTLVFHLDHGSHTLIISPVR